MQNAETEKTLWESFQKGDEVAYTRLYGLHVKAMYRYGMSLVSVSEAFVLDCIHDVFTEMWIKRERLTVPDNIRYYLLKSLKNRILHLLKRSERPHISLEADDYGDFWSEPSSEEIFTQKEEYSLAFYRKFGLSGDRRNIGCKSPVCAESCFPGDGKAAFLDALDFIFNKYLDLVSMFSGFVSSTVK
jgi:hypothetical protein